MLKENTELLEWNQDVGQKEPCKGIAWKPNQRSRTFYPMTIRKTTTTAIGYFIKTNYGARKRFRRQSASLGKTIPCPVSG